jgi:hypothetical protein
MQHPLHAGTIHEAVPEHGVDHHVGVAAIPFITGVSICLSSLTVDVDPAAPAHPPHRQRSQGVPVMRPAASRQGRRRRVVAVMTFRVWWRTPSGPYRRAWTWVLVAAALQILVMAGHAITFQSRSTPARLGVSVFGLRNLLTVALLVAVLAFPGRCRTTHDLLLVGLEAAMVSGAALLGVWYFVLGPALGSGAGSRGLLQGCVPKAIFYDGIGWLRDRMVLLPGVTTLARLVARARGEATRQLWEQLAGLPSPARPVATLPPAA